MDKPIFEAYVHKSSIPMKKGESVSDFNGALHSAVKEHASSALKTKPGDDVWPTETFHDSVVVAHYKGPEVTSTLGQDKKYDYSKSGTKYHKIPFSRDKKTGNFQFGQHQQVERRTSFEPVSQTTVQKSMTDRLTEEEFETVSKAMWKPVSLFKGII